ncbi:hypothetical protein [Sphingorhabdus sp.]|jgi:hypothetical protein|uniref:hypothetical protein n=1 Tax=Sphingorhabdus sp. TaxID=1902408 RepID=UPI0037CAD13E
MSINDGAKDGGKLVAENLVQQTKALIDGEKAQVQQFDFLDPITPEEMADAQARLGPNAGNLTVLREARENRRGRPRGSKNRRSEDFARFILSHGQHPAVTMMQIQTTPPEVLVERSRQIDPIKRRMSYGDAQALRVRCAEGLLPYIESKKPVAVELDAKGDFNLLVPGLNISEDDARKVAEGTFVYDAEYHDIEEGRNDVV